MNTKVKQALAVVADRIRAGQTVLADESVLEQYESIEQYLEMAYEAQMDKDVRGMKRHLRDAQRHGAGVDLVLPGMEHAALPAVVFRTYPDGSEEIVPWKKATKGEIRTEVARMRRAVAVQDRVVGQYEAALGRLDDLGVGDEVLGEEIEEKFGRELES